ncbi:MAG: PqiC family protein [Xanthomonadales bacterium]|nr:PqiC family protein [Xanthomonadales bacterium]
MRTVAIILVLSLAACANVPEARHYVLSTQADGGQNTSITGELAVGLGRIDLPRYLRQPALVIRTAEQEVRPATYHRWAEPLDRGIRRSFALHLDAELPGYRVEAAPTNLGDAALRVDLEVDQFHGSESGEVVFGGRWKAYSNENGRLVAGQAFRFRTATTQPGYSEIVKVKVEQIALLSSDVAASLAPVLQGAQHTN